MDLGLTGRVALITGASGEIGAAIGRALAAEGARVALGYHTGQAKAEELAEEIRSEGGEAMTVGLDLEDAASVLSAVQRVEAAMAGIDVLVAAAVVWPQWPPDATEGFAPTPPEVWRQQLGANVAGTAATVQAVLPHMQRKGWGRIVLLSTTVAEDGFAGMEAYGAAKAALQGLSRSLIHGVGGRESWSTSSSRDSSQRRRTGAGSLTRWATSRT